MIESTVLKFKSEEEAAEAAIKYSREGYSFEILKSDKDEIVMAIRPRRQVKISF